MMSNLEVNLLLKLPRDHSSWARSVRWSCGRPGYEPMFDWQESYQRSLYAEYARARAEMQILNPYDVSFLPISTV